MAQQKMPVTMRSVIQRINRKLAREGKFLKATRGARLRSSLGNYVVIERYRGMQGIGDTKVNPEKLARELGVLQPWEEVAQPARS